MSTVAKDYVVKYITSMNITDALVGMYTGAVTAPVDCTALQAAINKNITGCTINVAETCTSGTTVINTLAPTAATDLIGGLVKAYTVDVNKSIADSPSDYALLLSLPADSKADAVVAGLSTALTKALAGVITTSTLATMVTSTPLKQGLADKSAGITCDNPEKYNFSSDGQKTAINAAVAKTATDALLKDPVIVSVYDRYLNSGLWDKFIHTVGIGGAIGIGVAVLCVCIIMLVIFIKLIGAL